MAEVAAAIRDTMALLDDPDLWVVQQGVPLFRSHVRRDKDGKELYAVTDADLPKIAKDYADRERSLGYFGRVTDGHIRTDPAAPESSQPKLLGYMRNARMGELLDGTPAILYDEYTFRHKLATVRERPYRSAEYRPLSKRICGVAALLRDPALDLGTVLYEDAEGPVYCYSLDENTVEYMTPAAAPGMPSSTNMAPPRPQAPPAAPAAGYTPDEERQFQRCYEYLASKGLIAKAATPAAPAPAPNPSPAPKPPDRPMPNASDEQVQQYQAQLDTANKMLATQQAAIDKMAAERKREKAERLLDKLQAYQFDAAEELDGLLALNEADWPRVEKRIKRDHHVKPGHVEKIPVADGHVEGGTPAGDNREEMQAIVSYASEHGINDYEAARDQWKAAGGKK